MNVHDNDHDNDIRNETGERDKHDEEHDKHVADRHDAMVLITILQMMMFRDGGADDDKHDAADV